MIHEQLAKLAYDTVLKVMTDNEAIHPGNEWAKLNYIKHREHAINHLLDDIAGDKSEPHAEHALVRIAMMLAKAGGDKHGNSQKLL